jgi:pantetheine-phosphate adenylyltransferase
MRAFFPGTFDPPTKGHMEMIERASSLFDKLIVGIGDNTKKKPLLTKDIRHALLQSLCQEYRNSDILCIDTLTVDLIKEKKIDCLIRGIRSESDLSWEQELANANYTLQKVETLLMLGREYPHISGSLIKEIAAQGGDISPFVPEIAVKAINDALTE